MEHSPVDLVFADVEVVDLVVVVARDLEVVDVAVITIDVVEAEAAACQQKSSVVRILGLSTVPLI